MRAFARDQNCAPTRVGKRDAEGRRGRPTDRLDIKGTHFTRNTNSLGETK